MKVILLKDVPKIGRKYEVKDVAEGYALNFLIPRGMAEQAMAKAVGRLEILKKQMADKDKLETDLFEKSLAEIDGKTISVEEKANDKGHLFAQVNKTEIVKILRDRYRFEVSPESIVLDHPIKTIGEFEIEIKVHDQGAKFKLDVKPK
jgi:large subunit ribosomal protein L9